MNRMRSLFCADVSLGLALTPALSDRAGLAIRRGRITHCRYGNSVAHHVAWLSSMPTNRPTANPLLGDHDARSARLLSGNCIVAGLGSHWTKVRASYPPAKPQIFKELPLCRSKNPNGVSALSAGLRGTSYPGSTFKKEFSTLKELKQPRENPRQSLVVEHRQTRTRQNALPLLGERSGVRASYPPAQPQSFNELPLRPNQGGAATPPYRSASISNLQSP